MGNVTCIFYDMRTPMSSRSTETEITTDRRGCKKLQNRIQLIKINPCPAIIYENGNFGSVTITNIVYSILRPESCVLEYRIITGSGPVIYQKKKVIWKQNSRAFNKVLTVLRLKIQAFSCQTVTVKLMRLGPLGSGHKGSHIP